MVEESWFFIVMPLMLLYIITTSVFWAIKKMRQFFEYQVITLAVACFIGLLIMGSGLTELENWRQIGSQVEIIAVDILMGVIILSIGLFFLRTAWKGYMRLLGKARVPFGYEIEKMIMTGAFFIGTVGGFVLVNTQINMLQMNNDAGCLFVVFLVFGTIYFPLIHERIRPLDRWASDRGFEAPVDIRTSEEPPKRRRRREPAPEVGDGKARIPPKD